MEVSHNDIPKRCQGTFDRSANMKLENNDVNQLSCFVK